MVQKDNLQLSQSLLEQVADKWTILILAALCRSGGKCRFNAIRREVSGLSQKTLTHCLRKLERNGIIERRILDLAPIGVEYAVTPLGHSLKAPFEALYEWVEHHLPDVDAARTRFDSRAATFSARLPGCIPRPDGASIREGSPRLRPIDASSGLSQDHIASTISPSPTTS
jgi:DNA-binding HxlR family transcriptional regulator